MKRALAPIAILGLALTGCGGNTTPAAKQEPTVKCLEVKPQTLDAIAEGASGAKVTPVNGAAVESNDFEDTYMIAMEFSAPGGGNEVGVWASDSLKPSEVGPILSVDSMAKSFTTWPDAMQSFNISASDHGVEEAKTCLSQP